MQNKFCIECGSKINTDDKFCSNCGTRVEAILESRNRSVKPHSSFSKDEENFSSFGIIFTNLPVLAESLNCELDELQEGIEDYIQELRQIGHQYIILDAAENEYHNLSPDDSWQDHVELLQELVNGSCPYVFILGGNEVIPMPCIENEPAVYSGDTEIYSDLPYSYLETVDFPELLWNGELMYREVKCYVGRFPTGENMTITDLSNYLNNARNGMVYNHISFTNCFGISAQKWKITSEAVISKINRITELNLSPDITEDNIDGKFQSRSDAYFYNLHGSDSPGSSCYFGDDGHSNPKAVFPHNMASASNLNFLMTEACYGGRYIGYSKDDSMLLTSISNNTLSFLGSNVVAFGNPGSSKDLLGADILVNEFINFLIEGYTTGESFARARIKTYELSGSEDLNYALTTILEFSLYGDPLLMTKNGIGKFKTKSKIASLNPKRIKSVSSPKSVGILNEVRSLVDQEVEKIGKLVNEHLYSHFNVEPRHLQKVFRISGKFGTSGYNFVYLKSKKIYPEIYSVFTDNHGKISKIYSSK